MLAQILDPNLLLSFTVTVFAMTLYTLTAHKFIPMPPRVLATEDPKKKYFDYRRYIAIYGSLVHATLGLFFMARIVAREGVHFDFKPNNSTHFVFIGFSLGYYLVDTAFSFKYKYGSLGNDVHHFVVIAIFLYIIHKGIGGNVFIFYMLLAEIPNPFMHIRKNLMMFNNVALVLNVVGIIFTINYMLGRVVLIGIHALKLSTSPLPFVFKMLLLSVWYLSLYWSFVVVEVFLKSIKGLTKSRLVGDMHAAVEGVGKSRAKSAVLHAVIAVVCFGPPLYFWAHEELY